MICSVIETYASECKLNSICENWRATTVLTCNTPTCPSNSHYDECGPGCDKACDIDSCQQSNEIAAGCYCNENMVNCS